MNNDLGKLHDHLLEIMVEIDRLCRKHNITYFLDSGTALGAVRHKGFIPWDDDVDIGMMRDEYDRFIDIAEKELSPKFFLQTRDTDKAYYMQKAKIRMNGTFFPEGRDEWIEYHHGIFVDIYPFDYICDNKRLAIKDIKKARFLLSLVNTRVRRPPQESLFRKIVRKLSTIIPEEYLFDCCHKQFTKYNSKKTQTVTCYVYMQSFKKIILFNVKDIYPSIDIEFEGLKFQIMNGYDKYLQTMYGDYMKLPPKKDRFTHFHGEIKYNLE